MEVSSPLAAANPAPIGVKLQSPVVSRSMAASSAAVFIAAGETFTSPCWQARSLLSGGR